MIGSIPWYISTSAPAFVFAKGAEVRALNRTLLPLKALSTVFASRFSRFEVVEGHGALFVRGESDSALPL
jgi:hypothetical protein